MRIVLGVTGGIAAYKACSLLRLLTEAGHEVTVVPTESALRFVGEPTWAALSGRPVSAQVWDDVHEVAHVRLGQQADLVIVAPCTADTLARAAAGMADDLLTNVLLTARCPVLLAPAMHTEMWLHAATQANVATLRSRGVQVLDPASGRLTGADTGPGRLPDPEDIAAAALALASTDGRRPLAGRRVLVTTGGTREPLDPVRYLGNHSSGRQGYAVAEALRDRGAEVVVVAGATSVPAPAGVQIVPVGTAAQMEAEVLAQVWGGAQGEGPAQVDAVVMAAAVADFRPAAVSATKMKKRHEAGHEDDAPVIELERTPDILAGLVRRRGQGAVPPAGERPGHPRPVIVGFAAETGDAEGSVLDHARAKLARKGCDLLVANAVGEGLTFGQESSTVHLLRPGSDDVDTVSGTKRETADAVVEALIDLLGPT